MYDVVIAGAGPAGSIAATVLARAGARVLLLDRARFPRAKLCGDSVNPGAIRMLTRLGLDPAAAGGLAIDGMLVTTTGVAVEGRYPAGVRGRSLYRRDLDAALLEAAGAAGAGLDEGVLVEDALVDEAGTVRGLRVKRGGAIREVHARIVIAADGRQSRVARKLGISSTAAWPRRWAVGAYFEGVAGLGSLGEMHIRQGHYVGVAPLPGGIANACLVTTGGRGPADPARALLTTLDRDVRLGRRFADARRVSPVVALGPLAIESSAAGVPGLLLAGDAAGFIDPMTGDGLRLAFEGAELAARHALRALEHGVARAHLDLAADRQRAFRAKWRFNRALRALVAYRPALTAAGAGARLAPAALRQVIRYAGDAA